MNRENMLWKVVAVAVASLMFYLVAFYGMEWRRTRRGPWEAVFLSSPHTPPALIIRQPALGIQEVRVVFEEESAPATNLLVRFDQPRETVPWGTVVYQDPVTFPGVVTLHLFGHEIEMMPRTLSLNRKEAPWAPTATYRLLSRDKLPAEQLIRKKYRREVNTP